MDAIKELITPIQDKLFRFALRMVGSVEEAEDVVQEVWIKLWKQRDYLDKIQNVEAWCMQLTRNISIDHLRSKHRRTEGLDEGVRQIQSNDHTPDVTLTKKDLFQKIQQMMNDLPEQQRDVMHLRDIEGYAYQEIADMLDLTLNQVKINLFRARTTIRKQIEQLQAYDNAK